ncbi:MAG: ArsR family transcriptional regulator [Candidatus Thermoplasmatota archaeon]|nr:ArsR family transcriptional regulator [Candidatus Thermoplasmatota archaeon]
MRPSTIRTFAIVMVIMTAALFVLNLDASAKYTQMVSFRETEQVANQDIDGPIPVNGGIDGSSEDPKHISLSIENIQISSMVNKKIFPNTPVDFIIDTKGPSPEVVTLFLDNNHPSMNITYDLGRNTVLVSESLYDLIRVDMERTSAKFNATSRHWEILFALSFDWTFPKDFTKDIEVTVVDTYGNLDNEILEEAYTFEPDIEISGEPIIIVDDPNILTDDLFIKGGENILLKQISIHFEGVPEVSPDPGDVTIGVEDSFGRFWEYSPSLREQLGAVSFSLPVPKIDGPDTFEFVVMEHPSGSVVHGGARFDLKIDSTPPSMGDFRYNSVDGNLFMSWALNEEGSGLRTQSMKYSILDGDEMIIPWTDIPSSALIDDRLKLEIDNVEGDDLQVRLSMADRVGNDIPQDQIYYVTTDPVVAHDISIDGLRYSPNTIVINQVITFFASVHNHGTEDEGQIQVDVMEDGNILTYMELDLPAGSTREIRWTWRATEGTSYFEVSLDPQGRVPDEYMSDNILHFIVEPDYLDVTAREDYMLLSDSNAQDMDIISITFSIRSIGGIESGPIKVIFMEEDKFMGMYQVPSIYKEEARELVVYWKVDISVRNLSLMIDPYNEILESIEDNNLLVYQNPFFLFIEPTPDENVHIEEDEYDTLEEEVIDEAMNGVTPSGGTTWKGEEIPQKEEVTQEGSPSLPVIISPTPEEPKIIPPLILPTVGFILGTGLFSLTIFGLRSEVLKFKLLGLLIPLYSKIKKSKIEKGTRHEILGYLKAKPGANYSELKRNLDLNDGSLVHHLRVLEREDMVYSKKMGKYKLFYVSSYRRQATIRDYISPFQLRIMEIILQNPGIVPNKLSKILDRTQTDMSYHLGELSRNGLLEKRKKGRNIHYFISEEYSDILTV